MFQRTHDKVIKCIVPTAWDAFNTSLISTVEIRRLSFDESSFYSIKVIVMTKKTKQTYIIIRYKTNNLIGWLFMHTLKNKHLTYLHWVSA